jgi:hypothetical protein
VGKNFPDVNACRSFYKKTCLSELHYAEGRGFLKKAVIFVAKFPIHMIKTSCLFIFFFQSLLKFNKIDKKLTM